MSTDLHEELDRRLRDDGAQWRTSMEATADAAKVSTLLNRTVDRRGARRGRLTARLAVAASVIAVLAIAVSVAVWRSTVSQHANHPPAGTPTVSRGSGYGDIAPGTHACDASEFRLISVSHEVVQHEVVITASLADTGASACSMPGHGPLARLVDASGNALAEGADATLSGLPAVVVPPGAAIDVQARWWSTCHLSAPASQLQLRLQGERTDPTAKTPGTYVTVLLRDIPTPGCSTQEEKDPTNVAGVPIILR
jgi:hypothetical protein